MLTVGSVFAEIATLKIILKLKGEQYEILLQ